LTKEEATVRQQLLAAQALEESHRTAVPVQVARADGSGLPVDPAELPRGLGRFAPGGTEEAVARGRAWAQRFVGPVQMASPFRGASVAESFGRYALALRSGRNDDRLYAAGNEYEGTGGGFATSDDHRQYLLGGVYQRSLFLQYADLVRMIGPTLSMVDFDRSSGLVGSDFGGLSATLGWPDGPVPTDMPVTQAKLVELIFTAKNCVVVSQVSNNLIDDAPAYGASLQDNLGIEGYRVMEAAFFAGSGVGQPRGLLRDPALITVAKEPGQVAGTIVLENLQNAYSRLHPSCQRSAAWYASPSTVPQLLSLQLALGVAGVAYPAMQESNGAFTIFGLPVRFSEMLPNVGTIGDIILADLSQYVVPGFLKNLQTFRMLARVDGAGKWSKPYTPRTAGAPTLSWCSVIATR